MATTKHKATAPKAAKKSIAKAKPTPATTKPTLDNASAGKIAPTRDLKGFYYPEGEDSRFGFARLYWAPGDGPRGSLAGHIARKRAPAGAEAKHHAAARMEVLLPPDAPEEYSDIDRLVRRYEEWLPADEPTALAQVTLRFPDAPNLHSRYEESRAWVREEYVLAKRLPVILVLHAPYLAGSEAPGHVHALILPARLTRFGWLGVDAGIATDKGKRAAEASWEGWQRPVPL